MATLASGQERFDSIPIDGSASYQVAVSEPGTLRVSVGELGSLDASPSVQLFDPSGVLVDSAFNGGNNAQAQITTEQTGTYTAVVSDWGDDQTMDFRIRALSIPSEPILLADRDSRLQSGEEISSSIPVGSFAVFPIDVGVLGTLRVSVGELGSQDASPSVQLFDPSGALVDSAFNGGNNAQTQITTEQTGTYTAVVSDWGDDQAMEFRIRALSIPSEPILIADRDSRLQSGEEISSSIPVGSFAVFPIDVGVLGTLRVSVGELGLQDASPSIQLFDPSGVLVDSAFNGGNNAQAQITTEQTGTYTAVVSDWGDDQTMDFRIRALSIPSEPILLADRDSRLQSGEEISSSIPVGSFAVFPIDVGVLGTLRVAVGELGTLDASPSIQLFDPSGALVDSAFNGGNNAQAQITTEQTGTYTAVVSDWGDDQAMEFRIRALSIPSEPILIADRDSRLQSGEEISSSIPVGSFAVFPIDVGVLGTLRVAVGELGTLDASPSIQLFDPSGALVDSAFNGGNNAQAQITTEQTGTYTAVVSDWGDDQAMDFRISLDIDNSPPTEIALADSSIDENEPIGALVGQLSTVDPDAGERFTYDLVAGVGDENNSEFEIVGSEVLSLVSLDFESTVERQIRVRSTDSAGQFIEGSFNVRIDDVNEMPSNLQLDNDSVEEMQGVGTRVGNFSATDPDMGDVLRYELVAGDGDDGNQFFRVIGGELQTSQVLDYSTATEHSIRAAVIDSDGLKRESIFTISVNPITTFVPEDVNEDSFVSPIDALLIINFLNSFGSGPVVDNEVAKMDVNEDGFVSPIDALLVINQLNQRNDEGEGEWLGGLVDDTASGSNFTSSPAPSPSAVDEVLVDLPLEGLLGQHKRLKFGHLV